MHRKGITLIELVVSMAIMIIVLTMVSSMFVNSNTIYKTGIDEVDMQNNIEKTMYNLSDTISKSEEIKTGNDIPSSVKVSGYENIAYIKPENINGIDDIPPIVYYKKSSDSGKYDLYERVYKNGRSTVTKWVPVGSENNWSLIDDIYFFLCRIFDLSDVSQSDITDYTDVILPSYYRIKYAYKQYGKNYIIAKNENKNQICYIEMTQKLINTYTKDYDKKIASNIKDIIISQGNNIYNIKIDYEIGNNLKAAETSIAVRNFGGM